MHKATPQQAPNTTQPPADFPADVRQFDEPILFLIPKADSCPHYQAWKSWITGALAGELLLFKSLRESAISSYEATVKYSNLPPPSWPHLILKEIDATLLAIHTKEFLLATNAAVYLFIDCERRAEAVVRRCGKEVATR